MENKDVFEEASRRKWMRDVVICAVVGIVALWIASGPLLAWVFPDLQERSQIGDSFGLINALFSGLALAGVIVAILLQREELRLQRKELEETRAELKRQADAAEKQEAALEKQRRAMLLSAAISAATTQVEIAERDHQESSRLPNYQEKRTETRWALRNLYTKVAMELREEVSEWEGNQPR
jgi:hypothetical protein